MNEILKTMKDRETVLKKAIEKAKKDKGPFPKGHLRISASNNRVRYYLMTKPGDSSGDYIKKGSRSIVPKLALKDYNQRFLKDAKEELARLDQAISLLSVSNADLTYQKLSSYRQELITPYIVTDELYAQKWQASKVKSSPFLPENLVYETERGEMVRSKSEAIIANILYELGIPYFYEKSLTLKNGQVRYPDFTLLHVRKRKEMYLEHFGLLDDADYLLKNLLKLDEYRENGIYPGKNLVFTYETGYSPLDIMGIKKMLKELFCD